MKTLAGAVLVVAAAAAPMESWEALLVGLLGLMSLLIGWVDD